MSDERKCAVYARFATKEQADPQTEKKLEAVRLLQEIGYKVAVAPVDFKGDTNSLKQIPPLTHRSANDPGLEEARALLLGEQTLVITGFTAITDFEKGRGAV